MFTIHRVPIFIDQFREAANLMVKKWESVSFDQENEIMQCLIPEVWTYTQNYTTVWNLLRT